MMWIWLVLLLVTPSLTEAACSGSSPTRTAANASDTEIQLCINAAVDGDTINVPSGSSTWTTGITNTKSVSVIAAGLGNTIITCSVSGAACVDWTTKATGGSPAGFSRLSGFKFTGSSCAGAGPPPGVQIDIHGVSHAVRIDNNEFAPEGGCYGLQIRHDVRGVADHNIFRQPATGANGAHVLHITHDQWNDISSGALNYSRPCCGDGSWSSDPTMGTTDVFMFEDNTMVNSFGSGGQYIIDDYKGGSRGAYRFNTFTNTQLEWHGTESNGRPRGHRHQEAYRNKFDVSDSAVYSNWPSVIGFRGGTGRVFDNAAVFSNGASLQRIADGSYYRRDNVYFNDYPWGACGVYSVSITRSGTTATATVSGFTSAGGNYVSASGAYVTISGVTNETSWNGVKLATGTGTSTFTYTVANTGATTATGTITTASAFDGNTDSTGYPCMDQIGRGKGILITDTAPADGHAANPNPPQWAGNASEPLYNWHNQCSPSNCSAGANPVLFSANGATDVVVANRDYYNDAASFTGATGIGRGLRSARPSTCTAGVAYWSTDGGGNWNTSTTETYSALTGLSSGADGGLDYCSATNTWVNDWYVPPTYPHSLISGGGGGGGATVKSKFSGSVKLR